MQYLALWGICEEGEVVMDLAVGACVCMCVRVCVHSSRPCAAQVKIIHKRNVRMNSGQFRSTVRKTELPALCNTHIKLTQ